MFVVDHPLEDERLHRLAADGLAQGYPAKPVRYLVLAEATFRHGGRELAWRTHVVHAAEHFDDDLQRRIRIRDDIARSKFLVLIGSHLGVNMHNTQVQNFAEAVGSGAQIVVVDPRFSTAAGKARWWLPIRPGTDTALLLAWIHVILEENLYDRDYIQRYAYGLEELKAAVAGNTPEWAYPQTSIAPETIREVAREMAEEIGYSGKLEPLLKWYLAPGYSTELMHVFVATSLRKIERGTLDDDENIRIRKVKLGSAIKKCLSGEIQDSKTVAALLAYSQSD